MTRRKVRKSEEKEAEVHYVDKQRGIAVVLEGEGKDLKGKGSFNTGMVLIVDGSLEYIAQVLKTTIRENQFIN